jgi:hypothetical protein
MSPYTLDDLAKARADLTRWQDAQANSTSNNPDKHQGRINAAFKLVVQIEEELKRSGAIPLTPQESLEKAIDAAHPKAQSRDIVTFEGKRYQRIFTPIQKSRSGKSVTLWDKEWRLLPD